MTRGLAIGRSIAEIVEERKPKARPQQPPRASSSQDLKAITITRDQIEVTAFGSAGAQYVAGHDARVEMEFGQFEYQNPYPLNATLGAQRFRGSIWIDTWRVSMVADDDVTHHVDGRSSDIVVEAA